MDNRPWSWTGWSIRAFPVRLGNGRFARGRPHRFIWCRRSGEYLPGGGRTDFYRARSDELHSEDEGAARNGGSQAPDIRRCARSLLRYPSLRTVTDTFNYNGTNGTNGSIQEFTVPAGVTSIQVAAFGAQGGCDVNGGEGGEASGTLTVTPDQVLIIRVGGQPPSDVAAGTEADRPKAAKAVAAVAVHPTFWSRRTDLPIESLSAVEAEELGWPRLAQILTPRTSRALWRLVEVLVASPMVLTVALLAAGVTAGFLVTPVA